MAVSANVNISALCRKKSLQVETGNATSNLGNVFLEFRSPLEGLIDRLTKFR